MPEGVVAETTITATILALGYMVGLFDRAAGGAMDRLISGFVSEVAGPMWLALVFWFASQGLRIAFGNLDCDAKTAVRRGIGMLVILAAATSTEFFNSHVRDFFYSGLPNAALRAVGDAVGGDGTIVASVAGTSEANIGSRLDILWAHVWRAVGVVYGTLGWGVSDFLAYLAIIAVLVTAGLGICACAVIFILSHFILALNIGIGPPFVACALFDATRPFFERWIGKLIALILVKVVALATTVITVQMQLVFLDMIVANPGDDFLQTLAALLWVFIIFLVGGFAITAATYVAYSFGGGLAIAFFPASPVSRGGSAPSRSQNAPASAPSPPAPPPGQSVGGWYFGPGGGGGARPSPPPRPVPLGARP